IKTLPFLRAAEQSPKHAAIDMQQISPDQADIAVIDIAAERLDDLALPAAIGFRLDPHDLQADGLLLRAVMGTGNDGTALLARALAGVDADRQIGAVLVLRALPDAVDHRGAGWDRDKAKG